MTSFSIQPEVWVLLLFRLFSRLFYLFARQSLDVLAHIVRLHNWPTPSISIIYNLFNTLLHLHFLRTGNLLFQNRLTIFFLHFLYTFFYSYTILLNLLFKLYLLHGFSILFYKLKTDFIFIITNCFKMLNKTLGKDAVYPFLLSLRLPSFICNIYLFLWLSNFSKDILAKTCFLLFFLMLFLLAIAFLNNYQTQHPFFSIHFELSFQNMFS